MYIAQASGYDQFSDEGIKYDDVCLKLSLLDGKREKIVYETPIKYSNLYKGNKLYLIYIDITRKFLLQDDGILSSVGSSLVYGG